MAAIALPVVLADQKRRHSLVIHEDEDEAFKKLEKKTANKCNDCVVGWNRFKHAVLGLLVIIIWVLTGATFYSLWYDWPFASALHYATQAGLSIGFGDDAGELVETDDKTCWFTVIFVMAGSSFIVGALGLFVSILIEEQEEIVKVKKKEGIRHRADFREDDDDVKQLTEKLHANDEVEEPLSCFDRILEFYGDHSTGINCIIAFIVWIGAGVIYGMTYEEWTFPRSLYFAVTGLSTAGLQAPTSPVDTNTGEMVFIALWTLTGVPVYALVLSQAAGIVIAKYQEQRLVEDIRQTLSRAEFEYAAALNSIKGEDEGEGKDNDSHIDFNEFLHFKLLRAGMMDQRFVEKCREQFDELDANSDGDLNAEEMDAALCFDDYDRDQSGFIELDEFVRLARFLKMKPAIEEITKQFNIIAGEDQKIGKKEFVTWYLNNIKRGGYQSDKDKNDEKNSSPENKALGVEQEQVDGNNDENEETTDYNVENTNNDGNHDSNNDDDIDNSNSRESGALPNTTADKYVAKDE